MTASRVWAGGWAGGALAAWPLASRAACSLSSFSAWNLDDSSKYWLGCEMPPSSVSMRVLPLCLASKYLGGEVRAGR